MYVCTSNYENILIFFVGTRARYHMLQFIGKNTVWENIIIYKHSVDILYKITLLRCIYYRYVHGTMYAYTSATNNVSFRTEFEHWAKRESKRYENINIVERLGASVPLWRRLWVHMDGSARARTVAGSAIFVNGVCVWIAVTATASCGTTTIATTTITTMIIIIIL